MRNTDVYILAAVRNYTWPNLLPVPSKPMVFVNIFVHIYELRSPTQAYGARFLIFAYRSLRESSHNAGRGIFQRVDSRKLTKYCFEWEGGVKVERICEGCDVAVYRVIWKVGDVNTNG